MMNTEVRNIIVNSISECHKNIKEYPGDDPCIKKEVSVQSKTPLVPNTASCTERNQILFAHSRN